MKIAIASDDGKTVASNFKLTKGFVIFEIEGNKITNREHRSTPLITNAGKSEEHSNQTLLNALEGCQAVISGGMGQRNYCELLFKGIALHETKETDIEKALQLYVDGKLINISHTGDHFCC